MAQHGFGKSLLLKLPLLQHLNPKTEKNPKLQRNVVSVRKQLLLRNVFDLARYQTCK